MNWGEVFGLSVSPLELIIRGSTMYLFLFLLFRVVIRRRVGAIGIGDFIGVWKSTANQDGSRAGVFGIRVQPGTQNDVVGGPDTDNDGTVIVVNQP